MRVLALAISCSVLLAGNAAADGSAGYSLSAEGAGPDISTASSTHYHLQSAIGSVPFATIPVASARYASRSGLRADARSARRAWSLTAHPSQAAVGTAVTLLASIASGAHTGITARFSESGQALEGCASVPVRALPASTGSAGVATCIVPAIAAGAHDFAVELDSPAESIDARAVARVDALASVAPDDTDLWWGGTAQNGWGLSVVQHGAIQFNVLYTYADDGKPVWHVMPAGTWDASRSMYSGPLYLPTSAPFDAYDPARFVPHAPVGFATIDYTGPDRAMLRFAIEGIVGASAIERQPFGSDDGEPRMQVGDLWWGGEGQNGWGLHIAQQGRMLFIVWYTYDALGHATWRVVPDGTWDGTRFSGAIYATTGSPWPGAKYSPDALVVSPAGRMTIDFVDPGYALLTYSLGAVAQTRVIVRQGF